MKNNKLKSNSNFILSRKANGFTLLLSILVVSVVLSVGLGIFDIMTKELKLSGLGRESQIAFYAADAGVECFFYWEIKHPDLADSAFAYYDSNPPTISCAGNSFIIPAGSNGPYGPYNLKLSNNSCAKIKVTKSGLTTTVESRGYNTKDCDSTSAFKVERAIQLVSTKQEGGDKYLPPSAPTSLTAVINADPSNTINLSWISSASEFYLYRSNDGVNYSQVGGTLTSPDYTDAGSFSNATVYYEVVAHNSYGDSESAQISISTTGILKNLISTGSVIYNCWRQRDAGPSGYAFLSGSHYGAKNTLQWESLENITEAKVYFSGGWQTNGTHSMKISKDFVNWTDITNNFTWTTTLGGDGSVNGSTDIIDISNIPLVGGGTLLGQPKLYLYYETNANVSTYCHSDLTPTVNVKFK